MMNQIQKIRQCIVGLVTDNQLQKDVKPHHLRGAIASLHPDNTLFHQHQSDGRSIYTYPLIQYKMIEDQACLVGLDRGADALHILNLMDQTLTLGQHSYRVLSLDVSYSQVDFGWHPQHVLYGFYTPWMALNQKNYERYQRTGQRSQQTNLLKSILIGNLLSMSKGLKYSVDSPVTVEFQELEEVNTRLKGNPMLGFTGSFSTRFSIPELWGIGKSTSRGFGTIVSL